MRNVDRVDLIAGLVVLAAGAFFAYGATEYRMGSIVRMGPGFVPFWMGVIAIGLGAIICATAIGRSGRATEIAWLPTLCVSGAIVAFGLLLPRLGLVPATFAAAIVAALGNRKMRLPGKAATAAVITLVCWLVFLVALGLPIRAFDLRF